MKYIIKFFITFLHLTVSGQLGDAQSRKRVIEKCTEQVYTVSEFQEITDSLQMSTSELCDYPIIFPIKKPERISSGFGMRYHPIYRVWKFHKGIDISATKGTPVYATGNGIVTRIGNFRATEFILRFSTQEVSACFPHI